MTTMASQITSLTVVYSLVYSHADQRKHQSPASLAFVWGIHRDRWIPRTKGQLRGKCFHLMTSSCMDGPGSCFRINPHKLAYQFQDLRSWHRAISWTDGNMLYSVHTTTGCLADSHPSWRRWVGDQRAAIWNHPGYPSRCCQATRHSRYSKHCRDHSSLEWRETVISSDTETSHGFFDGLERKPIADAL